MKVEIDPNQNVSDTSTLKISVSRLLDEWKPLNFRYGCAGQLYYEANGYLHVIRDPINHPKVSVKLRPL